MNQLKRKSSKIVARTIACLMAVAMVVTSFAVSPNTAEAAKVKVTKVQITKPATKTLVLKKGKKYTLKTKVTVKPNKKANKKVTFKTSNKKVVKVSSTGKLTAVNKGKATITVTSKLNKKKKATIKVIVGTPVSKVKLNAKSASIKVGAKKTLKATISPKKPSVKGVNFTTSNKKVATVTSKGVVTGKKVGKATIKATAKDGSGKYAKCVVTVTAAAAAKTPKPAATAIPEPKDTRTAVMVEDFQDAEIGNYLHFTYAGRDLAETGAKMEIVKDPANANNKLVKISIATDDAQYCGYDFAPVVSVSLGAIAGCEGTTLDDYEAIRFKTRVVSDAEHTYKAAVAYFAPYGAITKQFSFSTYDEAYAKYTDDDEKEDATKVKDEYKKPEVQDRINAQFNVEKAMARSKWTGTDPDTGELVNDNDDTYNKYMPEMHESIPADYGYSEDDHTVALANRTLQIVKDRLWFDTDGDDTTNDVDLSSLDAFDMVMGTTYPETTLPETTTWYLDDVQLIKKATADVAMTGITLNANEKAIEVGEFFNLVATKAPANTTDSVLFSSSDKAVATVTAEGKVTGIAVGTATITAYAKKDPTIKAECAVTVSVKSNTETKTQIPAVTDSKYTDNVTAADPGVLLDCTGDNDYGQFSMIPMADVLSNFEKCKKIKFTFTMSDVDLPDTAAKMTFALIHKDAASTYDSEMTSPSNGRIKETYADVAYQNTSQQTGITYDAATGLYTVTWDLTGVSMLDKVGCIMIARNGYNNEGTHFKVNIQKVEYTMKVGDEVEPDKVDGLSFTYPLSESFAATPYALGWSNWVEATKNYKVLTDVDNFAIKTDDSGETPYNYAEVPGNEYDGISLPLDNRTGVTGQAFYLEATVRATAADGYGFVNFAGSNTLDGSIYYPASAMKQYGNDSYLKRGVDTEWNVIKLKVDVPERMLGEVRLKGTGSSGFEVNNIKIEKYVDQDMTMADEPAAPVSRMPFGSNIKADMAQTAGGYGFTAAATDAGIQVTFTQQYGEYKIKLSQPVSAALTEQIIATFTSDKNVAVKVYDEAGTELKAYWNNTTGNTVEDVQTVAELKGKKIAGFGFMSQDTGNTEMVFTGVEAIGALSVKADMTQTFGGYGYTAAATDAGIQVSFTQQYGEIKLDLPEKFSAEDVSRLVAELTADKNVAIKVYDDAGTDLKTYWNNKTAITMDVATDCAGKKIKSLGFMSQDTGDTVMVLEEVSVAPEAEISADMTQTFGGYGYTSAATDGGFTFTFTQQYGEVKFNLGNTMTADEIGAILISLTSDKNIAIKLYDESGAELTASWNNMTYKKFTSSEIEGLGLAKKVASVGLMSQDTGNTVCTFTEARVVKDGEFD